jgi:hypothetical protein
MNSKTINIIVSIITFAIPVIITIIKRTKFFNALAKKYLPEKKGGEN